MNHRQQAKLYYLYMMSDGDISDNEKRLFNTICKKLQLDANDKKNIMAECKEITDEEGLNCIQVIRKNAKEPHIFGVLDIGLTGYASDKDKAIILWNLINLGYSDALYSSQEKETVDFLRKYWEIPESLYREMMDVAETCLALEKHKQWVDTLPETEDKLKKLDQIKKDIKFTQETIETTISEIAF